MALSAGTRIGPYEIVGPLGAGGMGEVYRARDTKLGREVALKTLPASFASDSERVARFEREARTLASLNHPHIAQIYGFEQSGEISALVMELIDGEDLSARIAGGALPLDEALGIARQIAEAFEAAHEHAIVHRDLKPANIKVRPDGTVKVLDFGLAKAMEPAGAAAALVSQSPTITTPAMTQAGMILGTAAYMSPEQARGKVVDKRADIWAFGVVVFEMLTGRRAFQGDDVSITLAAIIMQEPDWRALPAATPQIWLRPLGSLTARPLPGTQGGAFPFWSPDSRFIGFFADGKLKKAPIAGGPPAVLCDAPSGRGGSWSRDNVIVFAPVGIGTAITGLLRVSSGGGVPTPVTTIDPATGETHHRWPHFLPDGRHFLYTASTGTCCPAAKPAVIRIGSLDPGEAGATLFEAESAGFYSSGHLLFARDETLMAQPFDPNTRHTTGDPFPLAEHVATEGSRYVGASVSDNGTLVYAHGSAQAALQLTWCDRTGRVLGTVGDLAPYVNLSLSPDEQRVAVTLGTGTPANRDIWVVDVARNVSSRITFNPGLDGSAVWSPDGSRVAFESSQSGQISIRHRPVNGTAADEPLLEGSTVPGSRLQNATPSDWSTDGQYLAYTQRTSSTTSDVWVLPVVGDGKPFPLIQTEFQEASGMFSPDGRWLAYTTNESGVPNVYVQPFPGPGGKHQISRNGGDHPLWRADGKELFYLSPDGTLTAVPIDTSRDLNIGPAQALFPTAAPPSNSSQVYGVTKDGKRFLVNARPQQSTALPLTVLINWTTAIQR